MNIFMFDFQTLFGMISWLSCMIALIHEVGSVMNREGLDHAI